MKIVNSVITFLRGDDDALMVGLTGGPAFEAGDQVFFCLKATETTTDDIKQIVATTFTTYESVANAGAIINIAHGDTINLDLGTYYYTIWVLWEDSTYVTLVPPTKFILSVGGSHG